MRIIIFGTGIFWENRKEFVLNNADIVCFIDNSPEKVGCYLCGKIIDSPDNISKYDYDFVLIMSKYVGEMKGQLTRLGVAEEAVWIWKEFICNALRDCYEYHINEGDARWDTAILTTGMDYNGGTIAAVYAAKALMQRGWKVILCAQRCDTQYLDEIRKDGLDVLIAPILEYDINAEVMKIIEECQYVLVNVFQMLPIVARLNGRRPVLWWIHEPEELYGSTMEKFSGYADASCFDCVHIKAVGRVAKDNFNSHFPDRIAATMPYGIPDDANSSARCLNPAEQEGEKNTLVTFAVVGGLCDRKAQDVFVDAVKLLGPTERAKARFLIVGNDNNEFGRQVHKMAQGIEEITFTGNLSREEMRKVYPEIDVLVCSSREDIVPIVVTEAMMYGKACVMTDHTGSADFVQDGEDGMICRTDDAGDLCEKMRYFINHPKEAERVGRAGRKIYEEHFAMDRFADILLASFEEAQQRFEEV